MNALGKKMPLPFGLKLKRTRRYTVSSKSCLVARIQLLNNEFVEFTLSVESTGQESLEAVAQRLELREVRRVVEGYACFFWGSIQHTLFFVSIYVHRSRHRQIRDKFHRCGCISLLQQNTKCPVTP